MNAARVFPRFSIFTLYHHDVANMQHFSRAHVALKGFTMTSDFALMSSLLRPAAEMKNKRTINSEDVSAID
jgi:hypothetical protein